jgi:chromosome partitioning protein
MKTFLVVNPKGGSGKTTLATNLAGYFAKQGFHVALSDIDRQKSSLKWLATRSPDLPLIAALNGRNGHLISLSAEVNVIDSPAGLRDEKLKAAVKAADWVVVPIQASVFDIAATESFLEILRAEKSIRKDKTFVAMVGMRIDARTKSAANLEKYLEASGFPVKAYLSDAQIYKQAAEIGCSIFDMPLSKTKKHLGQWNALIQSLNLHQLK